ncbi:hypothetical protein IJ114_02235 [Candidatus Saccharibacteria bacterium]|nr:hypothetical protein [Candidatus Saccharibacteria bacterium]
MKKIHKRLLGVSGLALVAAITTAAYNMPDAGAVSTTSSGQVDISVNIVGENPEIKINSPLDGSKLTTANLHINTYYSDADKVEYILSNGTKTITIPSPELEDNATDGKGSTGEHDFYYNLKEFNPATAGYGSYTLRVVVTRSDSSVEDTISFSYVPATIDDGSIPTDENNNPIVDLNVKESVIKVTAIVLNESGTEVFRVTEDTNGTSPFYIVLPFSDHKDLGSGNYTVKFVTHSYNGLGQLVADQDEGTTPLVTRVSYEKKAAPDLPPDDTPPTPLDPSAGDDNNPETPAPEDTEKGDIVHVVVKDPQTGETILEGDFPVGDDGNVKIPFDQYNIPEGDYTVEVTPYEKDPVTGEEVLDPSKTTTQEVEYKGKTEENQPTTDKDNGNTVVPITNDGSVEKAKVIITDKDGNKIEIIVDVKPGQTKIEIPFDELDLPSGDYDVTIITYGKDPETGELAPNQNPAYVRPIVVRYESDALPYQFIDSNNSLDTHVWNRNSDAGESVRLRIPTYDTYKYFDRNEVYFTTLANRANLFTDANRLNTIYFEDSNGSLNLDLLSSFLATLPNGQYILGVSLTNGARPTVIIEIEGDTGSDCTNNPNPVIDINVEEGVEKVEIIVYDKNGKELFRFETPVTSITTNHIALPFNLYCLGDGDYQIAVIPYIRDENGNLVPLITEEEAKKNATSITYGAPKVPNTGDFFANLNLSQKDFLLTGLIVFTAVTAGGIVLLKKQENRR